MSVATAIDKRESLNLNIKSEDRDLIDRAALALGRNSTEFVLDAALAAAEEALGERTRITVSPEVFNEFLARLDAPPNPNPQLLRTLRTLAPWDVD